MGPGRTGPEMDRIVLIYTILIVFLLIAPLYTNIPHFDFHKAYYPVAVDIVRTGSFSYVYEGFKNMPAVGLLLLPFGLFDRETSRILFIIFDLVVCFLCFGLMQRSMARNMLERWLVLLLFVCSHGLLVCIQFGQLTPLAVLLTLAAIALFERDRKMLAGCVLSAAFVLKMPVLLVLIYFLIKRQWRLGLGFLEGYLAFWGISLLFFGLQLHRDYLSSAFVANMGQTILAYNNQNIFAFLMRFIEGPIILGWDMVAVPMLFSITLILIVVGIMLWLGWQIGGRNRFDRDAINLELALFMCLMLIVFPVSWDHYYFFTIFPLLIYARTLLETGLGSIRVGLFLVSFALINLTFSLDTYFFLAQYRALWPLISTPFLGTCLLGGLCYYEMNRVSNPWRTDARGPILKHASESEKS